MIESKPDDCTCEPYFAINGKPHHFDECPHSEASLDAALSRELDRDLERLEQMDLDPVEKEDLEYHIEARKRHLKIPKVDLIETLELRDYLREDREDYKMKELEWESK